MKVKNLWKDLIVKPGEKVRLSEIDPEDTLGFKNKDKALEVLERNRLKLADLHTLLYAENRRALLIVLQGMDACGKDGTQTQVQRDPAPHRPGSQTRAQNRLHPGLRPEKSGVHPGPVQD